MIPAPLTPHDDFVMLGAGAVALAAFATWLTAIGDFFWMASLRGRLVLTTAFAVIFGGAIVLVVSSRMIFGAVPTKLVFLVLVWMVPVLTRLISNAIAVRQARKQGIVSDIKGKPLKTLFDVERRKLDDAYSAPMVSSEAG